MFRMVVLLLALVLVPSTFRAVPASAAAASSRSASPDAIRADIQAFVKRYIEAANRADATAMSEMFRRGSDVSSITDGVISRGWDAIREDDDQIAGKEGTYRFALGTIDVTPLGAAYALAVAPVVVTVAAGADSIQADGALTLVLEKRGGAWKILHEHMSGQEPEQDQDLDPGDGDQDPGPDQGD